MNKKVSFVLLLVVFMASSSVVAQNKKKNNNNSETKGHEIIFHVSDSQDSLLYLAIHHKDNLYLKDTAFRVAQGKFVAQGAEPLDEGLYTLASQNNQSYLNLIIDNTQHFEYFLDTTGNVQDFSVKNSDENSEMLRFQQKSVEASKLARSYHEKIKSLEEQKMTDSIDYYREKQKVLNEEMIQFIDNLIAKNPTYLFSKMQKAFQAIDVPDAPLNEDGTPDQMWQIIYYRTHYWDNVDLGDRRFVYLPVLESKYQEYFHRILQQQEVDTIIRYVDMFLEKAAADTFMFRYLLDRLVHDYQVSNIIGQDAVFVYLVNNYHLKGKTPWIDEDLLRKYGKRAADLEKVQIGKKCPALSMPDTTGVIWRSTSEEPDKYMVIWFYDPTCGKCKKQSAELKVIYDSLELAGTRNFEVYGIGNDSDVERWKRYVRESQFNWINVGGAYR
ncbi:DUF5106 domain-containing protein [Bacteroidales bacterium OttesenSCG-928-A14]|nr:DUF5106 domain-containing protein [Bacteroidales bacterium OttesenSCG-928-A14]